MTKKHNNRTPGRLCPLHGFAPCVMERCMLWDDDWLICGLNCGSLYSTVRVAVCDAAVEVAREYAGENSFSQPPADSSRSEASPSGLGEGGNTSSVSPAGCHLPLNGKAFGKTDKGKALGEADGA